jgi:hypothetical protein
LKIEYDELQKEFQRGSNHALTNFEGSSGPYLTKKQKKEKIEVEKKQKILKKLVFGKEDKGFNVAKGRLVDNMLDNEFLGCFPFGNDPLLGVSIDVHHFKITTPNIVYCPLSYIHKDEKNNHTI